MIGSGREIRRRRKCLRCQKRFTTYERIEAAPRMVVKKSGRREIFSRGKILAGLEKACKKRGISDEKLEDVIERIEIELFEEYEGDIETRVVGEKVSECLLEIDHVAYVRFASVYCGYSNVEDFRSAVDGLAAKRNGCGGEPKRESALDECCEASRSGRRLSSTAGMAGGGRRLAVSLEK